MKINEIEQQDTVIISKLICDRLGIHYSEEQEKKLMSTKSPKLLKVLLDIENIKETWELNTPNNQHSYGRKYENEIIKLWSVPYKTAQVLENLVILSEVKNILEIGTSAGYSTLHLAQGASVNDGNVHTIELLEEKCLLASKNFKQSGLGNIDLIKGEAGEVLKTWNNEKLDFVFLDADKENYGKYFDLLLPLMKIGGIIVADNINDYGHLMEDYLQKVTGTHLPYSRSDNRVTSYYMAALDNGLMITKKIID